MSEQVISPAGVLGADIRKRSPFWAGLGFQVGVSMVLGVIVGMVAPEFATSLKILGDLFLRLIKTAVGPLIFLTVTTGILAAGDIKRIGKVGLMAMIYFEIVSSIALVFGMGAADLFGVGKDLGQMAANAGAVKGAQAIAQQASHAHASLADFLLGIFPDNFIGAFVRGDTLQVLVIAVIFGFALLHLGQQKRQSFEAGLQTISGAFFGFIHIIMRLAPIGTFGAMAFAIGTNGTAVLMSLITMVVLFHVTTFLFVGVVLGAVSLIFRFNMIDLLRFIGAELVIVYGTASSEAVLPRLLEKLPQYGASRQTVGLVLPTGYSFNLDGAALFMSFSIIFLANAYNVPLSFGQQIGILIVMMLTSKGVAAVAGGAFVVFAATVTSSGIVPVEGLALIFGVYRFMSMLSALCNVVGNAVATIVIAKLCGEFQPRRLEADAGPAS